MLHERLALPSRERGHRDGLGVALVFEQDREVVPSHGADRDLPGPTGVVVQRVVSFHASAPMTSRQEPERYRPASERSSAVPNRVRKRTSASHSRSRTRSAASSERVVGSTRVSSLVTIRPSTVWPHAPTTRPFAHTVGPALPLVSNRSASCRPRYQARSFHPMTVASSPGRRATQGPGGAGASRSSGRTNP